MQPGKPDPARLQRTFERTWSGSEVAVYQVGSSPRQMFVLGGLSAGGRSIADSPMGQMVEAAARNGVRGTILDLPGTGASRYQGALSMDVWLRDIEHVYRARSLGAAIWVGSSLGAWLMLLLHRRHPEWFVSMCALAPAVDWDREFLKPGFASGAVGHAAGDVTFGMATLPDSLFDSMNAHRVLGAPFAISVPLHIIQGDRDTEALPEVSQRLSRHLTGDAVTIERLGDDDHGVAKLASKGSQVSFERWLYGQVVGVVA